MKHRATVPALCILLISFQLGGAGRRAVPQGYQPQVGDLIFQSLPHDPLTDTIEGSTKSPFSHVGIVVQDDGHLAVLEAFGPVMITELGTYLGRGREGGYAAYRFQPRYTGRVDAIIAAAKAHLGKPYDRLHDFGDEAIYSSELIYKAFQSATGEELGVVRAVSELDWQPYEAVIKWGGIPLDRRMITPKDLSEAKQLRPVHRQGI